MNENSGVIQDFLTKNLKPTRLRGSSVGHSTLVESAESDRGRVLYSAAFRRLQQKAQVFSLEPNAAVRSRLTHSLEVSQVGRYISDKIIEKSNITDTQVSKSLAIFVETACLAHDIGNPPFGHFGEAAIQEWFNANGEEIINASIGETNNLDVLLQDFREFDGNPQGLRILSKLQWNNDEFGLNLTTTALLSCIKYLRCAGGEKKTIDTIDNKEKVDPLYKKSGYFIAEEELVKRLWAAHDIEKDNPYRFPLSAIMEAADDISYCISDLEDSVEKGIVSLHHASCWIKKEWDTKKNDICEGSLTTQLDEMISKIHSQWGENFFENIDYTFTDFRTSVTRSLVEFASSNFIDLVETKKPISTLLPENSSANVFLELLKEYCRKYVYCDQSVELIEYAGYTAISGLLEIFKPLLKCNKDRFERSLESETKDGNGKTIVLERKLLRLFPEKHIKAYKNFSTQESLRDLSSDEIEWLARAHLIVDFLSGMTDDYSIELYRTLSGIKTL